MIAMPKVVTHLYDPNWGVCRNICSLSDFEASRVLDRLRHEFRPNLKPNYLARRRRTEQWLSEAASKVLGRTLAQRPAYFFLGDFSYVADLSRPAALVIPIASLPPNAITFTLGDSMTVANEPMRRVHSLPEIVALFAEGEAVAEFGLSDGSGFQTRFIEMQVWDHFSVFGTPPAPRERIIEPCFLAGIVPRSWERHQQRGTHVRSAGTSTGPLRLNRKERPWGRPLLGRSAGR